MSRILAIASALVLFAVSILEASPVVPTPDFWYVVPDAEHASDHRSVRGIVLPSSVRPTVQTSPSGSTISWLRPDGTRQSFAVQGLSRFAFEPGPLKGTTFVPFGKKKLLEYDPVGCCACASWQDSEESFEQLSCVPGCEGCGCEGCICSPGWPCPDSRVGRLTLVAHNDPSTMITVDTSAAADGVAISDPHGTEVRFRGRRLSAGVNSSGRTEIENPDSIEIPGMVASSTALRGAKALFAWSSREVAVIAEQPRSIAAPSFVDGTIDFRAGRTGATTTATKPIAMAPVTDRCWVCGTHPNSDADVDAMQCIPGTGTCYRCINFACLAPER